MVSSIASAFQTTEFKTVIQMLKLVLFIYMYKLSLETHTLYSSVLLHVTILTSCDKSAEYSDIQRSFFKKR
jgi:hypothetical protein